MSVVLTRHAIERYVDRVKPTHEFWRAKNELEVLVENAGDPVGAVEWHDRAANPDEVPFDCYLVVSDGIALGLKLDEGVLMAVSLFVPGNTGLTARRRVRRAKRRRSQAKKYREKQLRRGGVSRKPTSGVGWPD